MKVWRNRGLGLCFFLLLGCGDDGGDPPTISALSYSPDAIPTAQQSTVTGTLRFEDPDADLSQLGVAITLPDGTVQPLPLTALQGYTGQPSGQVTLTLSIFPPVAGTYDFEVWVIDAEEHASNRLQGSLSVE